MEIILIRHGKPRSAHNPVLNAAGYAHWIRHYNASDVAQNSRPTEKKFSPDSYYVVSSDLQRAIHSAKIYMGKAPNATSKLFREMEIPRYKLPIRIKAWTWVYLCRALWMAGIKGNFESYAQAKIRAELGAEQLIKLAQHKDQVILFGHGYMNLHIRKVLINKGWKLHSKSNQYWGVTQLSH